mgnify:CR=1 FL=1
MYVYTTLLPIELVIVKNNKLQKIEFLGNKGNLYIKNTGKFKKKTLW